MNKKAQAGIWAYALMVGLIVIILGMALAPAGHSVISDAMNASTSDFIGLDCSNSSISNFAKGTCVITDFSQAYFFGALIIIGGGIIISRIVFN